MPSLAEYSKCTGCSACAAACPKLCIQMEADKDGFWYPKVQSENCINCKRCEEACPVLHPADTKKQETRAYAAYSLNLSLRTASSSGGIFSELATEALKQKGVVYGAAYDSRFRVRHIRVTAPDELERLRGAKYAQSDLADCFPEIRAYLKSGTPVLFSGTPCQTAGLKSYLGQPYSNLLCVDFVCHGVPSPTAWDRYVQYRADLDNGGALPERINLRCKESGWSRYSYSVDFRYSHGTRYVRKNGEDPFMRLFVGDYISRESCGNCPAKGYDRVSDLTLGDFWGIWNVLPEMDDDCGTSLILTHSPKGEQALKAVSDRVRLQEVTLAQASQENPSLLSASQHKPDRREVLDRIAANDFPSALLLTESEKKEAAFAKVKRLLKRLVRSGRE